MSKITYQEIAAKAGLSIATISRIVNTPDSVSISAKAKVNQAIIALGGDPNDYFTEPKRGKIIIFNAPLPSNPFYLPIVSAARSVARGKGYVLLENEDDLSLSTIDQFLSMIVSVGAYGVISANTIESSLISRIDSVVPCVMCSEAPRDVDVPFVLIDNAGAAYKAVKHLALSGCRRIAMINGSRSFRYGIDRYNGYRKALSDAGLAYRAEYVSEIGSHMDFEMAEAAVANMLTLPEPPDAIFCVSDLLAAIAIRYAAERGFRVPEDISIIGFDDQVISRMTAPSITTIRQPVTQMGALAADMIIKRIENRLQSIGSVDLDTELVIRGSSRK